MFASVWPSFAARHSTAHAGSREEKSMFSTSSNLDPAMVSVNVLPAAALFGAIDRTSGDV